MSAIDELTSELAKLPGIGRKTATRLTYFLIKQSPEAVTRLVAAIKSVSETTESGAVSAEELAASAEELGAQAQTLQDLVARFEA